MSFVFPETFLVGYTTVDYDGLYAYLKASGNTEFADVFIAATKQGVSPAEALCSMYAKLCYAALTVGHNDNVSRVRDIPDNLRNCFDQGHGSVFEHATLNFVIRNCSRVFTHELVRHRVGTAFSQTSGRYVRTDRLDFVADPLLEPVKEELELALAELHESYKHCVERLLGGVTDFTRKKQLTSALRRMLPNGQANEVGFSVNIRELRHMVMVRTSRHAEWEIRYVFDQVYRLVKQRFPLLFYGATEEEVDGLVEVRGMRTQPY